MVYAVSPRCNCTSVLYGCLIVLCVFVEGGTILNALWSNSTIEALVWLNWALFLGTTGIVLMAVWVAILYCKTLAYERALLEAGEHMEHIEHIAESDFE
jgi:hypothetical protein